MQHILEVVKSDPVRVHIIKPNGNTTADANLARPARARREVSACFERMG